jgi:hypothetical protein
VPEAGAGGDGTIDTSDASDVTVGPVACDGAPLSSEAQANAPEAGSADGADGTGGADASAFDASIHVDAAAGWELTVYFTPVESFHTQPKVGVVGCATNACVTHTANLGSYPADFVSSVKAQGAGRITSPPNAGKYLNWSINVGYWLDDAPRDARGGRLISWVSAAADPVVPYDTPFRIVGCGRDYQTGAPLAAQPCSAILAAAWVVTDRFTAGAVGAHFDLYIGEEDRVDFANTNPYEISAKGARVHFGP